NFCQNQPDFYGIEESLNKMRLNEGDRSLRDSFFKAIDFGIEKSGMNYISVIKELDNASSEIGTKWLQGIVDSVTEDIFVTTQVHGSRVHSSRLESVEETSGS
ncbi:MAG: hypothetical protein KKH84_04775, partial [Proteobacteria bacterium]|nr:hypothetical protein [Pseudomonadota bacterium]